MTTSRDDEVLIGLWPPRGTMKCSLPNGSHIFLAWSGTYGCCFSWCLHTYIHDTIFYTLLIHYIRMGDLWWKHHCKQNLQSLKHWNFSLILELPYRTVVITPFKSYMFLYCGFKIRWFSTKIPSQCRCIYMFSKFSFNRF